MPTSTIIKADGTTEVFSPERLAASLNRAGAGMHTAERIANEVAATLVPGSSSREIYTRAFALLRREARPVAARYALRRALLEFGPSGHPFEDFVSHLFEVEGWSVETRKILMGKCVAHEVDFYAHKGEETMAAELKYHNDPGYKTDVKTALYVKARFEDIFSCTETADRKCPIDRGILVTNTKFTSEAVRYAECAGLELLGWHYPETNGLFERMARAHVYPITTLTTLTRTEKRLLIENGIIAVDQLPARRSDLSQLRFTPEHIGEVVAEADALMHLPHPEEISA